MRRDREVVRNELGKRISGEKLGRLGKNRRTTRGRDSQRKRRNRHGRARGKRRGDKRGRKRKGQGRRERGERRRGKRKLPNQPRSLKNSI
jgi:hypothetical protein